jgi:hypothetical protein
MSSSARRQSGTIPTLPQRRRAAPLAFGEAWRNNYTLTLYCCFGAATANSQLVIVPLSASPRPGVAIARSLRRSRANDRDVVPARACPHQRPSRACRR